MMNQTIANQDVTNAYSVDDFNKMFLKQALSESLNMNLSFNSLNVLLSFLEQEEILFSDILNNTNISYHIENEYLYILNLQKYMGEEGMTQKIFTTKIAHIILDDEIQIKNISYTKSLNDDSAKKLEELNRITAL